MRFLICLVVMLAQTTAGMSQDGPPFETVKVDLVATLPLPEGSSLGVRALADEEAFLVLRRDRIFKISWGGEVLATVSLDFIEEKSSKYDIEAVECSSDLNHIAVCEGQTNRSEFLAVMTQTSNRKYSLYSDGEKQFRFRHKKKLGDGGGCRDLFVNEDGSRVLIREDEGVLLFDNRGKKLASHRYEYKQGSECYNLEYNHLGTMRLGPCSLDEDFENLTCPVEPVYPPCKVDHDGVTLPDRYAVSLLEAFPGEVKSYGLDNPKPVLEARHQAGLLLYRGGSQVKGFDFFGKEVRLTGDTLDYPAKFGYSEVLFAPGENRMVRVFSDRIEFFDFTFDPGHWKRSQQALDSPPSFRNVLGMEKSCYYPSKACWLEGPTGWEWQLPDFPYLSPEEKKGLEQWLTLYPRPKALKVELTANQIRVLEEIMACGTCPLTMDGYLPMEMAHAYAEVVGDTRGDWSRLEAFVGYTIHHEGTGLFEIEWCDGNLEPPGRRGSSRWFSNWFSKVDCSDMTTVP